jgi:hypothetical protein
MEDRGLRIAIELEAEVVVGLVRADSESVNLAVPFPGRGAVTATDLDGVDAAFFLEA